MTATETKTLGRLVRDVLDDFSQPDALWQFGVLLISLGLAWFAVGWLRRLSRERLAKRTPAVRFAIPSLFRALFSLLAALFVFVSHWALQGVLPVNALRLALVPLLAIGGLYVAFYMIRRVWADDGKMHGIAQLIEKVVGIVVWLGMALYMFGVWGDVLNWLDSVHIGSGKSALSLLEIGRAVIWVLMTVALALWLGSWIEDRLMGLNNLDMNLRVVLIRISSAALIVLAVLVSLSLVGIDLTVLSVFSGALGVGLGLGLQKIASNYVSGFIILLDRSLRLGDMITVGANKGSVTEIRTRYSVVRGSDGVETLVPNEMLVSGVVQNYSYTDTRTRIPVRVRVSYHADPQRVIDLLQQAAVGVAKVLEDPTPAAFVVQFADNGMEFELGYWLANADRDRLVADSEIHQAIWQLFRTHHIQITGQTVPSS